MLGIGINENVYLGIPTINDKGTLGVLFKEAGDPAKEAELKAKLADNPFADWDEGGYSADNGSSLTLLVFPFDSQPSQSRPDEKITLTIMKQRIDTVREPLFNILSQYIPDIKNNPINMTAVFDGCNFDFKDTAGTEKKLRSEAIQKKIYTNIVTAFVEGMKPYQDNPELLFRVKFTRQSAKKAFPRMPDKFLNTTPFMESMKVPASASKVKFTSYEINNGLNKSEPISQDTADNTSTGNAANPPVDDPFAIQQ